jgi:DNA-binding MarR family transcriptional regulator
MINGKNMRKGYDDRAAIGKRLRRLSHAIDYDARRLYKANGIKFEQRWFGVINQLMRKGSMSVQDISQALGITHVSVSQTRKSLEAAGYIISCADKNDARRRLLILTKAGHALIDQASPIWEALNETSLELNKETDGIVLALDKLDAALSSKSLYERPLQRLKNELT